LSSRALLSSAIEKIEFGGDQVIATSSFWQSDAWPIGTDAPVYINAVCQIKPFDNDPALLLQRLHEIEAKFGRLRDPHNRWSSRTLDLDLLDYNGIVSQNSSFPCLPHPRIAQRDFVLIPIIEVSPNWVHPITKMRASFLLSELVESNNLSNCIQISL
jgi:2-amino-4-hydroxy-6-hydroxymethyldihydropteridine diphosphokinase